jgi:hypothetical protein
MLFQVLSSLSKWLSKVSKVVVKRLDLLSLKSLVAAVELELRVISPSPNALGSHYSTVLGLQ